MKHIRVWGAGVFAVVLSTLAVVAVEHAQSFQATLSKADTINSTLYSSGKTIDIAGTVNGDVFCAGQTVTVSGTVHGDVICAGQTVDISGTVDGDIRAAGQTVTVSGTVSRNLTVAAQTFQYNNGAEVKGDATITAADSTLAGSIGRDVVIGGSTVSLKGTVGRNVRASAEKLSASNGAVVSGNLEYTSSKGADIATGATVAGKVTHHVPEQHKEKRHDGSIFGFGFVWFLYVLIASLLIAMALVLLAPGVLHRTAQQATDHLGKTMLVGLVAGVVVPIVIISLMVSIVGIPLALLALLTWMLIFFISGPVAGYYLGSMVLSKSHNPVVIMALGGTLLVVLYFIPFIGFLAIILASLIGTGAILLELKRRYHRPVYHVE